MRYDGTYAKIVSDSISLAITNLATCITDTTNIPSIPSDFERSQDINNVITGIQNIKLNDINSEIDTAINVFEGKEALNRALASLLKNPFENNFVNKFKNRMEAYLNNESPHSKDEIIKAYINGKISKEEYDYYNWIWNMKPEELLELSKTLSKEQMNKIYRVRNLYKQENTKVKKLNAILYGLGLPPTVDRLSRVDWAIKYTSNGNQYGIDQQIYKRHMWYEYETKNGKIKILGNSPEYFEAINKGIKLTPTHDSFIEERIKESCERHPGMTKKEALEILECIDTGGGMCSIVASAEAIAYQYADKPNEFEKQFGFPSYDENHNLNDEIYIDLYIYSNKEILLSTSKEDNVISKIANGFWKMLVNPNPLGNRYIEEDGRMHRVTKQVIIDEKHGTNEIPEMFASSDSYDMKVESIYQNSTSRYTVTWYNSKRSKVTRYKAKR